MDSDYYKPQIIENVNIDGIAMETILPGKKGKMCSIKFITSRDLDFKDTYNNIVSIFCGRNAGDYLNRLLVIIKPDNKAYVYREFPFKIGIKASKDLKKGQAVYKGDFSDITSISFSDDIADINPKKGDRIIWLFRINWSFGLYFDFSRHLESEVVLRTLGTNYKKVLYFDMYTFLSGKDNFNNLVIDGWFPFTLLLDGKFDELIKYYEEDKKFATYIEEIIRYFDEKRLEEITTLWWSNQIFGSKKKIIESALNAYKKGEYINCIKNLVSEIEGIIRYSLYQVDGIKKPKTHQLKEFIVNSGKNKFDTLDSLSFPIEFMQYLNDSIFRDFDIEGDISSSRHAISHGIAKDENYTQERALQLILTLDQIYRFIP